MDLVAVEVVEMAVAQVVLMVVRAVIVVRLRLLVLLIPVEAEVAHINQVVLLMVVQVSLSFAI
jgi:hypothetical protein